jgi:hypothetical protein
VIYSNKAMMSASMFSRGTPFEKAGRVIESRMRNADTDGGSVERLEDQDRIQGHRAE